MKNLIIRYVRDRKGQSIGCVIAKFFPEANKVAVTGSLCNTKVDTFIKKEAVALAEERALAMVFNNRACRLPFSLKAYLEYMAYIAGYRFGDADVVVSTVNDPQS